MDPNLNQQPQGQQPPQQPNQTPQPLSQYPGQISIKPAWQVEAMQKVWSEQGGGGTSQAVNDQQAPQQAVANPYPNPVVASQQQQQAWQQNSYSTPPPPSLQIPSLPQQQNPPAYTPPPLPPSNAAPVVNYSTQPSRSKGWAFLVAFLALFVVAGIIALYMLVKGGAGGTPQETLTNTLVNALQTQTYNETLTTKAGDKTVTQSRIADFRKVGEPHVYIENVTGTTTKEVTNMTIIGGDYYAKKHFNEDTISKATEEEKKVLNKINDQWVQITRNGSYIAEPTVDALKLEDDLDTLRVIVPAPVIVGYFRDNEQTQLAAIIKQNTLYGTGTQTPTEEQMSGEAALKFKVTVDADKVRDLNKKAAEALGVKDTTAMSELLQQSMPSQMEVWSRKSDNRLLQYSYQKNGVTYTYKYEKIDQSQEVTAPKTEGTAPEGANASETDSKDAVSALYSELADYATQGNNLPSDDSTLKEFVAQRLDAGIAARFIFRYQSAAPQKGYIHLQVGKACNADKNAFANGKNTNFALLTKLDTSLYCVDNNQQ